MSTHGITFGKVIAGAGLAAGAVLLCAATPLSLGGLSESVSDFFSKIPEMFAGGKSVELGRTGQAVLGAGLAGGSYALYNAMKGREEDLKDAQVDAPGAGPVDGGYAEQIAMNRAMMRCRAAMAAQTPGMGAGPALG